MKSLAAWLLILALAATPQITVDAGPGREKSAEAFEDKAEAKLEKLEREFGLTVGQPITIVLAFSAGEWRRAMPEGAGVPDWAAAVAFPSRNLIVIKSRKMLPHQDVDQTLAHELAHLALHDRFQGRSVPQWLEEGLTMHLAEDWGVGRQIAMTQALSADRLIPWEELVRGFPESDMDARTAYAQSYYMVAFIRDRYGSEALGDLIHYLGRGARPDHALTAATGLRLWELEEDFLDWVNRRFSWLMLVTGPATLWLLGAVVLVLAWLRRRRAAKRTIKQWEDEENQLDGLYAAEGDFERSGEPGQNPRR
jgi:MYXO-CTERM domain-containing protein